MKRIKWISNGIRDEQMDKCINERGNSEQMFVILSFFIGLLIYHFVIIWCVKLFVLFLFLFFIFYFLFFICFR